MAQVPYILIVEDQANTAEMLTSYFEAQGYEVTAVGWGKDAIKIVEKKVPDLIMLDIRLPDIDGYEVCRQLRAHRRTEHVPIIFLTERRERGDKLTGLELGAVDYITKPFDVQELRLRVRNVLRRSSLERLSHPITSLPAASLADERLRELLTSSDWSLLSVGLRGLKKFAEAYGFVARDDVVRAVGLMLGHVVNEVGDPDAFIGHLDDVNLFVVVTVDKVKQIQDALTVRLDEAMAFFYPRADWEAGQKDPSVKIPRMSVAMGVLKPQDQSFASLEDLKKAIIHVQRAV
ncbi:MAG TPA: response regulator transcription factor [Chloroflexi bacterium]|nr:response regulator transcription factor [Chloroflexota bacterium]